MSVDQIVQHKRKLHWLYPTPGYLFVALLLAEMVLMLTVQRFPKGWAVLTAIACVGGTMILLLFWFILACLLKKRFQFTIRSLLLLTLAVAMAFSWLAVEMKRTRKQRETVAAINDLNWSVTYDFEWEGSSNDGANTSSPKLLQSWLGQDFFAKIKRVSVRERLPEGMTVQPLGGKDACRDIPESHLQLLADLPSLERIELADMKATPAGLKCIEKIAELESLEIDNVDFSDTGLGFLEKLGQLRELCILNTQIADAELSHLNGLTQLRSLYMEGNGVTDAGLQHLKGLTHLEKFILHEQQITGAGLQCIQEMAQLRDLNLSLCPNIGDEVLPHLHNLTQIQKLNLWTAKITDSGLKHLEKMTQLENLYLGGSKITDEGLKSISRLTHLQELNLMETGITDEGLVHLQGLSQLSILVVFHTKVTAAGVDKLQKMLPKTHIFK